MLNTELKKTLKVSSFSKAKYKPLSELGLVEPIKIQVTKSKPKTPNALKITDKGVAYLVHVAKWNGVNLSKEVKSVNNSLAAVIKEAQESSKLISKQVSILQSLGDKISKLEDGNMGSQSHLDLSTLKDITRKHSSSTLPMAPADRVIQDLFRITGISVSSLKHQIIEYYMNNKIDLHKGQIANSSYLLTSDDGSKYGFIEVR